MKNIFRFKSIMRTLRLLYLCVVTTVLLSCEKNDDIKIDSENLLFGVWTNSTYDSNENTTTFERVGEFPDEKEAISFLQEAIFVKRTSGWCGTPPLTFFNIEGTFVLDKNIIKVDVQSFPESFQWKIIELDEYKLVVKRELTDQEKDHRVLMDLFNEIQDLSRSVTCIDSNDWKYVAYGTKACGGPQGYIPYSKKIDTAIFLEKVETYKKLEDEYNKKWGIISDCSIPAQPKRVDCENGYPVLKY